jgi:hypothetical protein
MTTRRVVLHLLMAFALAFGAVLLLSSGGNRERKPAQMAPPATLENAPKCTCCGENCTCKPECKCGDDCVCGDTCKCTGGCKCKK